MRGSDSCSAWSPARRCRCGCCACTCGSASIGQRATPFIDRTLRSDPDGEATRDAEPVAAGGEDSSAPTPWTVARAARSCRPRDSPVQFRVLPGRRARHRTFVHRGRVRRAALHRLRARLLPAQMAWLREHSGFVTTVTKFRYGAVRSADRCPVMKRTVPDAPPFEDLLWQRLTRRTLLASRRRRWRRLAAGGSALLGAAQAPADGGVRARLQADPGQQGSTQIVLPPGYSYDLLVRWGESLWSSVARPRRLEARRRCAVRAGRGGTAAATVRHRTAMPSISFRSTRAASAASCA